VGLGVVGLAVPVGPVRRGEEEPEAAFALGVATVDDAGEAEVVGVEADTDLLPGLADDGVEGVLALLELAAGQVPQAVGVAGALPHRQEDLVVPHQHEHDVDDAGVGHGRRRYRGPRSGGHG
jgi:hypothetical protein